MRIGLVGEAPNDTEAIKNLLNKKYSALEFFFMLNNINGSNLDNQKTKRLLRIEYEFEKPDIVIFIRDLDSVLPNKKKLYERKNYFTEFNSVVNKKGILLLNIYEIEALILADYELFNRKFDAKINKIDNVMLIEEPKEFLKRESKKYNESLNGEIFAELSFENVHANCLIFQRFIKNFEKLIAQ